VILLFFGLFIINCCFQALPHAGNRKVVATALAGMFVVQVYPAFLCDWRSLSFWSSFFFLKSDLLLRVTEQLSSINTLYALIIWVQAIKVSLLVVLVVLRGGVRTVSSFVTICVVLIYRRWKGFAWQRTKRVPVL
jgi:hypothetical protein